MNAKPKQAGSKVARQVGKVMGHGLRRRNLCARVHGTFVLAPDRGVEGRHGVHGDAAEVEKAAEGVQPAPLPPLLAVGAALHDAQTRVTGNWERERKCKIVRHVTAVLLGSHNLLSNFIGKQNDFTHLLLDLRALLSAVGVLNALGVAVNRTTPGSTSAVSTTTAPASLLLEAPS